MLTGFSAGTDNAENKMGFQHSDVLEAHFVREKESKGGDGVIKIDT